MTSKVMSALTLALVLAGCGSDPGSGTETLYLEANAFSDGSAQGTFLQVSNLRRGGSGGDCVDDATVIMIAENGTEHALPYIGFGGCLGLYQKSDLAWSPGWRMRVTAGSDRLEAFLAAPGLTTITAPTNGFTFGRAAAQPLRVTWRDESGKGAQSVTVDANQGDYNQTLSTDSGSREIPATAWAQAETEERIRVTRETSVNLAGGVTGSTFRARTQDDVTIVIQ